MSKTIKLEDETYNKLEGFRDKRETFSGVVARLLEIHEMIGQLEDVIEGGIKFREGQHERLEQRAKPQ